MLAAINTEKEEEENESADGESSFAAQNYGSDRKTLEEIMGTYTTDDVINMDRSKFNELCSELRYNGFFAKMLELRRERRTKRGVR